VGRNGENAAETEGAAEEKAESGLGRGLDDSGEFDVEATNEKTRSVLADWRRDDFRTVHERMRRLTVLGADAVLAGPDTGGRTRGRRERAGGHVAPACDRRSGNRRRRRHGVGPHETGPPGR